MLRITGILAGLAMVGACSATTMMVGCSSGRGNSSGSGDSAMTQEDSTVMEATPGTISLQAFNTDSAYLYTARQVAFGPRVPNSEAHKRTAEWLIAELKRHGAEVTLQKATLKAFDGTPLQMANIMGSFNPEIPDRLILLAHYDTRPWADQDHDSANHAKPIDGANDGASGVGVLLETARALGTSDSTAGIDILFVDCEDYGTEGDDDSWALGAKYFAENPIKPGYTAAKGVLLDMVGGKGAIFPAEYFSRNAAPEIDDAFRAAASKAGHGKRFPNRFGSAVTDDHIHLIEVGIPTIDIIDYRPGVGFCPTWHTMDDNIDNIDKETLRAVGESLFRFIEENM